MHCKHLLVNGRKMSKSENNFFTLRDLMEKGWTGREIRFVLLAVKYREPLNFTFESLEAARKSLERCDEWSKRLEALASAAGEPLPVHFDLERFGEALDDDLNISAALGALFEVIRDSNRSMDSDQLSPGQARSLLAWQERCDSVLALAASPDAVPDDVHELLGRRAQARERKEWALSDSLRDQLLGMGWRIKDTKEGQEVSRRG
jgi:cysteinyl-tRNA synthetase